MGKVEESAIAMLAYADDVVQLSESHNKSVFTRLEDIAKNMGL